MVGKNNKLVKTEKQAEKVTKYSIKKVGASAASVAISAGLFFSGANAVSAEEQAVSDETGVEASLVVEEETLLEDDLEDSAEEGTVKDEAFVETEESKETVEEIEGEASIEENHVEDAAEENVDFSEKEDADSIVEEQEAADEIVADLEGEATEEEIVEEVEEPVATLASEEEAEGEKPVAELEQVEEESEEEAEEEEVLPGLGTVKEAWERIINENATYRRIASENRNGQQKANIIEFNPQDNEYKILVTNGEYVIGGDVMSKLIAEAEANGYDVAFAVNGDAYDTSNGVPHGMVITNGIMVNSSSSENRSSLGFLENGEYVYGNTRIDFEVSVNGETLDVDFLNRERKLDEENVYILTEQFATTTRSTQAGIEVILDVTTDGYRGVEIGESFQAVVNQIVHVPNNLDKNQTPIGQNQIVLSAHTNSSHYDFLASLKAGDVATIDTINNSNVAWEEVDSSIGIFHILMQDGVETSAVRNDTAIHPRTAVGFRPDGSMILMQNEGRQSGYASGLSFRDMVDYLTAQGADTIFNFDGGGSSTLAITMPGEESAEIVNRPSDGWERSNANGLLILKRTNPEATHEVEHLHLYPQIEKGYTTEVQLLENGIMQFDVAATDEAFNAVDFDIADVDFSVTGGIGKVDENGRLSAASGSHQGQIIVTHIPTGTVGAIDVTIVDSITQVNVDISQLSVAPGAERQLKFSAQKDGVPVVISPEALNFTLSNDDLGYITDDGVFHAYDTQGNGELTISYKDYAITIPVEVGRLPEVLNDFEGPLEDSNWEWRLYNANGTRGGDGSMSINYDERYVKYGDGSLRIDYDFATNPVTGTVTLEAGPKYGYGTLEGQPEAIGLWIYGDGNEAWIRIQLANAVYAGDVYVDWEGWKYIENKIPTTAKFPYELQWGVRVLATPNGAVNGKKGTIYVDGLRAVYDYKNDDLTAPVLDESYPVTPGNGAESVSNQPTISLKVFDPEIEDQPYTGINTDRTKLWINGVVHENVQHEVQQDGSVIVSYVPSAITALRPGPTNVRVRVEDNAGNKFFHEWDFVVEGYAVNLTEEKPASEKAYAGSTFDYAVHASDYEAFEDFNFVLEYSPNFVELLDVATDPRIESVNVEIDNEAGLVNVFMSGMKDVQWDRDQPLVNFTFRAENESGGQTGIRVREASVRQTGEVEGTHLALPGYDQEIEIPYTITYDGTTIDYPTTIRVTDLEANPVAGLTVYATVGQETFALEGTTDENGELVTETLTQYPIGTNIQLNTIAPDGGVSNTQIMVVEPSLGDVIPDKIGLTTGFNPATSVGITWETSLDVGSGQIQIADNENMEDAVTVQAVGQPVEYRVGSQNRVAQRWGATIVGLNPGTTYYYQVGDGDNVSEIMSFTTADETNNIDIAVIGDLQGGYHNFPGVFEHVEGVHDNYDLIMQVGDFNDNANDYAEWERIMNSMDDILRENIWAVTVGNHDSGNDAQAFTSFFNGPDNGTYVTDRNYWFEIGDAVVYVFDSEGYTYDPGFEEQKSLMTEIFNSTNQMFKMVLMHRPPFPQNYNDGDVRALAPFFEQLGVDIVFSGHDHIYSRTSVTSTNNEIIHFEPGQSTTYVTMGSSTGSKYYGADQNTRPWSQVVYDDDNPTFGRLTVEGDSLRFTAYAIENGETVEIDSFVIQKVPVVIESDAISGPDVVSSGAEATYTVNVPEGYVLSGVLANGEVVPFDNNNQFTVTVAEGMTLQAVFEANKADLEHALRVGDNFLGMENQFTPETTEQLATAIASGNDVLKNADATPEKVDTAVNNIYSAIGQLVSQGVDPEVVQQLEATIEQLADQIADLDGDNADLETQVESLQTHLENLEELTDTEIAALQADIAELQTQLAEREAELEDNAEIVEQLEEAIDTLTNQIATLEGDNSDLETALAALQTEYDNLEELTDAEIAALQADIAELQDRLAATQAEADKVAGLEVTIAELEENISQLEEALVDSDASNDDLTDQVAALNEVIESLQSTLDEALATNDISEEKIMELEAEVARLEAQVSELEGQLQDAENQELLAELEQRLAGLLSAFEAGAFKNEKLQIEIEELKEDIASYEAELGESNADIQALEERIAELEEQLQADVKEDQLAELEERYQMLLDALEAAALENEELQEEIGALQADIATYENQLGETVERITALEEKVDELEAQLQATEETEGNLPNDESNEATTDEVEEDREDGKNASELPNIVEVVEASAKENTNVDDKVAPAGQELPQAGSTVSSIGAGIAALLSGLGLGIVDKKRRRK